jgi:hypothetical protein
MQGRYQRGPSEGTSSCWCVSIELMEIQWQMRDLGTTEANELGNGLDVG